MPKPFISFHATREGIRPRIPSEFHSLLDKAVLRDLPCMVISYPGRQGSSAPIVDSSALAKALRKRDPGEDRLVVVAHNFTVEARQMLAELNAVCFSSSDYCWTDESWARVRDK